MIKPVINCPPDWCIATFPKMLRYQHIFDTQNVQLTDTFVFRSKIAGTVEVPAGYISDGASVPRLFQNIFPPYGKYLEAAVAHDYIYSDIFDRFTKKQADNVFRELLEVLRIPEWKIKLMYRGVKLGGKGGWD